MTKENNQINNFIQTELKKHKLDSIDPVTATYWLVDAKIRNKIESRPGSYLRRMCRAGLIIGAKKLKLNWIITRKGK